MKYSWFSFLFTLQGNLFFWQVFFYIVNCTTIYPLSQIRNLVFTCCSFFSLISQIHPIYIYFKSFPLISTDIILVQATVISHLNYCNCFLTTLFSLLLLFTSCSQSKNFRKNLNPHYPCFKTLWGLLVALNVCVITMVCKPLHNLTPASLSSLIPSHFAPPIATPVFFQFLKHVSFYLLSSVYTWTLSPRVSSHHSLNVASSDRSSSLMLGQSSSPWIHYHNTLFVNSLAILK